MQLITRNIASRRCYTACKQLLGYNKQLSQRHNINVGITSNFNVMKINYYCDSPPQNEQKKFKLMDFPRIMWPSFIYSGRNWIFANFIIRPYLDNDFYINDFIEGTKQAVEVISAAMSENNFETLKSLVSPEAFTEIKSNISEMTLSQRDQLSICRDDIYFAYIYQIGVMFEENNRRWVEITMCYHVLRGFKEMVDSNNPPPMSMGFQAQYQEKLFILNYRFIREYTKGIENSSWLANVVNHYKPVEYARKFG